jgi:lipopolysaccharide transport protein LptA
MAAFPPDCPRRRRLPRWACVLALTLGAAHGLPAAAQQQQEILLEAASSDFDRRNERLLFREVRIQQGETVISARHAETRDLDFSAGSWLFEGDVRISSPVGVIESERATIRFADHRLLRATAEGAPARFSRTMPEPEPRRVTGTANRIDYDLGRGELELSGQAALRDGVREVSGGRLVYRIAEDRLLASADEEGTDRVRIVITPPGEDNGADDRPDGGDGDDDSPETP